LKTIGLDVWRARSEFLVSALIGRQIDLRAPIPFTGGNMADLMDGQSVEMQGSANRPYVLKNVGGVYSCSCPAWRNQSLGIERRSCKHLVRLRGGAAEEARIGSTLPARPKDILGTAQAPPLLLAESWDDATDPSAKRPVTIVNACMTAAGQPTFAIHTVEVAPEEEANGVHYYLVEALLMEAGYEPEPIVHFDDRETPPFLHAAVRQYLGLPQAVNEPTPVLVETA
jgi:hypothetical protein